MTFGSLTKIPLPSLPSSIVSKGTRVMPGVIGEHHRSGTHWIKVGANVVNIDEDGSCPLALFVDGPPVRMTADVTKFSDGREVVKCILIQK